MNIIALIPARGGSKGLPGKNIIDFLNKPLIAHSIEYAKNSNLINKIYVSTDSNRIASISSSYGVQIIKRPKDISTDTASTESAIEHAISSMTPVPDIIVLLQPTSPLRPKNSLTDAINKFIEHSYDSLLSLSPIHGFIWNIKNNKVIPNYDYKNRPRRQDILENEKIYKENGSLYIFTVQNFKNSKNRLGGKIGHIIFDEEYGYEIDTKNDLSIIESISKTINEK